MSEMWGRPASLRSAGLGMPQIFHCLLMDAPDYLLRPVNGCFILMLTGLTLAPLNPPLHLHVYQQLCVLAPVDLGLDT